MKQDKMLINRSIPFDPVEFIGFGWSIVEQDERSLALGEVDISAIRLETALKDGEEHVQGEDKIRRLTASGHIRLDAKIFQTFWRNRERIPESWKKKWENKYNNFIYFDGTIFQDPHGERCVLCMSWSDSGGWSGFSDRLDSDQYGNYLSAVLKFSQDSH